MILLNSNAEHIFWLGRYLTRTQYLCSIFPFQEDEAARDYAHAFCLPAFDASSLNELILDPQQSRSFISQFQYAQNNILDLRGVLSAQGYAELNKLIQNASENAGYICDVAADCHEVLSAESEAVFLFFSLGQCVEDLDRQFRLNQDAQLTMDKIKHLAAALTAVGWNGLIEALSGLETAPCGVQLYQFSDHIQTMFEADA
ncbi:alpha-E domain-containing protein [Acinetobacter johnsonii]|nr:alpha-E domain-containing protein [Acinetobacter johnsonii]